VRDAQKAKTEFGKMIPREPDCIAAALDAVRDRLTAEEELGQLPAPTAMALVVVVGPPSSPPHRRQSVIAGEVLAGLAAAGGAVGPEGEALALTASSYARKRLSPPEDTHGRRRRCA